MKYHIFDQTVRVAHIVMVIGKVPSWNYFYVYYPRANGQMMVAKMKSHRFATVAFVKAHISIATGLHNIQLSLQANGSLLNDNSNILLCGIRNGANLHVSVGNVPPLPKL